MEATEDSKVRVFFIKVLRTLVTPISKMRKFARKFNRQLKIVIGFTVTIMCTILAVYLYHVSIKIKQIREEQTTAGPVVGTPMKHVLLDEVYEDLRQKETKDYVLEDEQSEPVGMVNTPGCKIPIAMLEYEKYKPQNNKKPFSCGNRAVYLRKHSDDKVIARIKTPTLKTYSRENATIECCYQFLVEEITPHGKIKFVYSNCTSFQNDTIITLESDFITVICTETGGNITRIIYEDMYAFVKKIELPTPEPVNTCKIKYNVLMLGMDSMSLPRAVKAMPRTVTYLNGDSWLGFRGFHKIEEKSFPNIMAILTGKNFSSITEQCYESMDDCNDITLWTAFKEAGYVTAYGEDSHMGKTFVNEFSFYNDPADHYMKHFFRKGDAGRKNVKKLCTGKVKSGQQVLDYALDFVNTYKKESFFGFFWINSLTYDEKCRLEIADKLIENFLNQLSYTGALTNTFVLFFSTHGLRYGNLRLNMEGYYDERMPMNFLWIPLRFKAKQPFKLRALAINQHRLVTPYDIYSTFMEIKKISQCSNSSSNLIPEGCPKCHSLLEVVNSNRTCEDAAITDKWCSCHKLYPLPIQDPIGEKSVNAVINYFHRKIANKIETHRCWFCFPAITLNKIHRIHFYYDKDKTSIFYVVAISLAPYHRNYEATVLRKDGYTVIGSISVISPYKGIGQCVFNKEDQPFCHCRKYKKCV